MAGMALDGGDEIASDASATETGCDIEAGEPRRQIVSRIELVANEQAKSNRSIVHFGDQGRFVIILLDDFHKLPIAVVE